MARGIGRPMAALVLSDEERSYLERQARRRRVARSLSDRCRMILRCADGLTNKAVAIELGVHEHTIGKWRRRFLKERIDGVSDEPRPGRPRTLTDDRVASAFCAAVAAAEPAASSSSRQVFNCVGVTPSSAATLLCVAPGCDSRATDCSLYSGENRRLVCFVISSLQVGIQFNAWSGIREQCQPERQYEGPPQTGPRPAARTTGRRPL